MLFLSLLVVRIFTEFISGTIFYRDGNGRRTLRVTNANQPIQYPLVGTFANTPTVAYLVDVNRTDYQFDEVQLTNNGHVAINPTGSLFNNASMRISYSRLPSFSPLKFL